MMPRGFSGAILDYPLQQWLVYVPPLVDTAERRLFGQDTALCQYDLTQHTFRVTIRGGEDGMLIAECPALDGCISQGRDIASAIDNVREAIQCCLAQEGELTLKGESNDE